ncbi:MAG: biopolymer transporter ExbD [Anaeromyxobacter sp.]|nr:biopolymer transporter ExbD [Anaeromyxobacter sp.]MBL0275334.1 biopolymer transporter ExbD [Anaeromyxobacter sp.]
MSMDVGSKSVRSDINVTPLVDVVLVLLIIFMVITPMLQRGKPVTLPEAKHVSTLGKGGDPILLSVTKDGRVWLDGELHSKEEVKDDQISAEVTLEIQARPTVPIMVKIDRDVPYKRVREVVLEVSKTHVMGVSLAASKVDDGSEEPAAGAPAGEKAEGK